LSNRGAPESLSGARPARSAARHKCGGDRGCEAALRAFKQYLEGPAPSFWTGLFVLNADGTERRLVNSTSRWTRTGRPLNVGVGLASRYIQPGGSFSPDGSEVVFAADGVIKAVDADGGTPRLFRRSIRYGIVTRRSPPICSLRSRVSAGHSVAEAKGTLQEPERAGQAVWVNRSTDFLAGTPLSNREGAPDFGELLLGVPELRLAPRLVDSRGTLRVVGALLLKAGGGPVSPFVLASPSATEGGSFSGCPWHRLHWC
jgi:hypothetical protein